MRAWFSDNPLEMFRQMRPVVRIGQKPEGFYVATYRDKTYRFAEVPLEIGKFFERKGDYRMAAKHLNIALRVDPDLREARELLSNISQRMSGGAAKRRFLRPERRRDEE